MFHYLRNLLIFCIGNGQPREPALCQHCISALPFPGSATTTQRVNRGRNITLISASETRLKTVSRPAAAAAAADAVS